MRFSCLKCGKCCSNIRGRIEDEEKKFIESNFFGKLPLVQLTSVEKMSLSLWGWEADKLKKRAEELQIDADIKPFRAVFDLNENKTIVISYFLDHDSCPFLRDNGCLVYEDRPLVCGQFPIQTIGLEEKPVFAKCPGLKDIDSIRKGDMKEYFGDTYGGAVKNDSVIRWHDKMIMGLIRDGKIRPVKDYPFNFLLRRVENSDKKDFIEYLMDKDVLTVDEIDKIIK